MSSSSEAKMVVLKSSDGEEFVVEQAVATQSNVVKAMIDDLSDDKPVCPLGNVTGKTLALVVQYCKDRQKADSGEQGGRKKRLEEVDAEFVKGFDGEDEKMFAVLSAAHYLDIPALQEVAAEAAANHIKDMPPEKVREIFSITNDFKEDEEAKLREEHAWAFEN